MKARLAKGPDWEVTNAWLAGGIPVFANLGHELAQILNTFVKAVGKVSLRLNIDKMVILTNEAQPLNTFVTKDGLILKILARNQEDCFKPSFPVLKPRALKSPFLMNGGAPVCKSSHSRYINIKAKILPCKTFT